MWPGASSVAASLSRWPRRGAPGLGTPATAARESARNMRPARHGLLPLRLLFLLVPALLAEPDPGRVPKVYNALITSNQNLEPSKAYPVYQPVLHDAFSFPFQPLFYGGGFPFSGLLPAPGFLPKEPTLAPPAPTTSASGNPVSQPLPTEAASTSPAPSSQEPNDDSQSTGTPPPPPATQSPIPLNEFGLPPQLFPLGRLDPAYNGFNQIGPFSYHGYYSYPGLRFYDPYDPFGFNTYPSPLAFGPLTNVLGQGVPTPGPAATESKRTNVDSPVTTPAPQTPPPEPDNLNILNYSSSDPNIPNVPPPPLLPGGLKPDKKE